MPVNIHHVKGQRQGYPAWHQRGRIKKVDPEGNVIEGAYAFNGEVVRISPRFQKNGVRYRIRPERPIPFFAAFLHEEGILDILLTPEQCADEGNLADLEALFEEHKGYFESLESPHAACDQSTEPSLRAGFSFNILQVLVEHIGAARSAPTTTPYRNGHHKPVGPSMAERIQRLQARKDAANGTTPRPTPPADPAPSTNGKKKGS